MRCAVCSAPAQGDLCAACQARRVVVRPADRLVVDRAARRTADLAVAAGSKALIESMIVGSSAGPRW